MTRMDIKAWRKSANGKAYTIRVGSTWVDNKGVTRLNFDAMPLPDEKGQVSCFLEAPRDRDDVSQKSRSASDELDGDKIPF